MRTTVKKRTVLLFATRKHSSRMPTVRSSPYGGGGGSLFRGSLSDGALSRKGLSGRPCPPLEGTWDQAQKPPGRNMGPGTETPLPRRNMWPGSQTGCDIIQRIRHTPVKILPCPKLRLRAVIKITIFK